jgi:hypothetical protein
VNAFSPASFHAQWREFSCAVHEFGYIRAGFSEATIMNVLRLVILSVVTSMAITESVLFAAPCESVESAAASTAFQKADALLSEKIVVSHLRAVGLTSEQAHARLSQLSEQQIGQLAAQADLIQAGGTIQHGDVNKLGPLGCMWLEIKTFFCDVYQLVFCWAK